ncbi:MAG: M15 family metallopeptidase [Saprospirales bacterium]|nr:M15 family metallopeptidase [Saprospirales bacterium]MBK8923414.1 M15 family metallopeptidase [Saprospirales bacterium]
MMKVKVFFRAALFLGVWSAAACGPEAETGAVFSKFSTPAGNTPADTLPPASGALAQRVSSVSPALPGRDDLTGKFDPAKHPDFVPVGKPYTDKPGMLLRREAFEKFKILWAAARKDGLTLKIISSTRTFEQQKNIWERKWARYAAEIPDAQARTLKILEYSAMPGTSRHHWGTDIDLNDLNNASFEADGPHADIYTWLRKNAAAYGFYQPYTAQGANRPQGYKEEKWHWSYLPLAGPFLRQYAQTTTDAQMTGFSGAETAPAIAIVQNYVLGVHPACK